MCFPVFAVITFTFNSEPNIKYSFFFKGKQYPGTGNKFSVTKIPYVFFGMKTRQLDFNPLNLISSDTHLSL